jgi:hypothetical protein
LESELAVIFWAIQSYKGLVASAAMMRVSDEAMVVALDRMTLMGTLGWISEDSKRGDVLEIISVVIYSDGFESAGASRWWWRPGARA